MHKDDEQEATWRSLRREAKARFGIDRFRPGQRQLIELALSGQSALGVLPTGAGKSLCYQLPALFLPKPTVVVSPLISLMQDQQEKLAQVDIDAAKMDSTLSTSEERAETSDIARGQHELIYVTPERLENPEFLALLARSGVSLLVVDEAHCVSQWGHDFRPAYLSVRNARAALGNPPVLAVTATATSEVADDILRQLNIEGASVVRTGIDRPGLSFEVLRTVNEDAKRAALLDVLSSNDGVGIIYVATVRMAEELREWLLTQQIRVERYHGKLATKDREAIQRAFMANEYKVIVATKAFGLGIDKPDIRLVVHHQFPDSLESYYQEAGRGGRDGHGARAVLLYRLEDRRVQAYFLGGKYPDRQTSWRVLQAIETLTAEAAAATASTAAKRRRPRHGTSLKAIKEATELPERKIKVVVAHLESTGIVSRGARIELLRGFGSAEALEDFLTAYEQRHDDDRDRLDEMMHYAQTVECRMMFLRRYFDEDEGAPCGQCDNCRTLPASNRAMAESLRR